MTEQQINVAIADIMGWTQITEHALLRESMGRSYTGKHPQGGVIMDIPNYCGDLNAMADAEGTLTFTDRQTYYCNVQRVMSSSLPDHRYLVMQECIRATARQRAEAFLRTVGRLVEE